MTAICGFFVLFQTTRVDNANSRNQAIERIDNEAVNALSDNDTSAGRSVIFHCILRGFGDHDYHRNQGLDLSDNAPVQIH